MLILVCMLMQCLRNSGFDRRYRAEAALAMRDVMSREDKPSFVIKDPRYVKESTNSNSVLHIFKGRWLVGIGGDGHEFGLRPADLHPHKVGFFLKYHQSFLKHARRWGNDGDVIRVIEISEQVFTKLYPEATTTQQPTH